MIYFTFKIILQLNSDMQIPLFHFNFSFSLSFLKLAENSLMIDIIELLNFFVFFTPL